MRLCITTLLLPVFKKIQLRSGDWKKEKHLNEELDVTNE
jgi:hypothetical protein